MRSGKLGNGVGERVMGFERSKRRIIEKRLGSVDWREIERSLGDSGWARIDNLLGREECDVLARLFDDEGRFRSTIEMERHRFGAGRYRYFGNPLPPTVRDLRLALYRRLVPIAREWARQLRIEAEFPASFTAFQRRCSAAGQARPTPLLLRYGVGDYNRLHQDNYGQVAFPFQVVIPLSRRRSYAGGELIFHEQPPRSQARAMVVQPEAGDAVVFVNRFRAAQGTRGFYRVPFRHGLSTVTRGVRVALGVIFHDAR
jgi:hypothetical protein